MQQYTIEDTFDVSAPRYWDVLFDEAYNDALWKFLDITWEQLRLERKGEGDDLVILREHRLSPNRELPRAIRSLIKGGISYTEVNTLVAKNNRMEAVTTPAFLSDKITNKGIYRLEVLGPNKVNRIWEGTCECRIPLLGKKVEQFIVEQIKDSFARGTDFTRKWCIEHPE